MLTSHWRAFTAYAKTPCTELAQKPEGMQHVRSQRLNVTPQAPYTTAFM